MYFRRVYDQGNVLDAQDALVCDTVTDAETTMGVARALGPATRSLSSGRGEEVSSHVKRSSIVCIGLISNRSVAKCSALGSGLVSRVGAMA